MPMMRRDDGEIIEGDAHRINLSLFAISDSLTVPPNFEFCNQAYVSLMHNRTGAP